MNPSPASWKFDQIWLTYETIYTCIFQLSKMLSSIMSNFYHTHFVARKCLVVSGNTDHMTNGMGGSGMSGCFFGVVASRFKFPEISKRHVTLTKYFKI